MADLTIVIDVRNNQTMSSYRIPTSGKLTFKNASATDSLVISAKGPDALPICESNQTTPVPTPLTIAASGSKTVRICDSFNGQEFIYAAQVGSAAVEDPIVIVERPKFSIAFDSASFILGAAIAAAVTYLILKSRAGTPRPQQG